MKTLILLLFVFLASVLYIKGGAERNSSPKYLKEKVHESPTLSTLQDGDLALRRTNTVYSQVSEMITVGEKRYSHSGIIIIIDNNYYVVHSTFDKKKGYDGITKSSVKDFFADATLWATYRFNLKKETRDAIADEAVSALDRNITFDTLGNLDTDDKLYCSEFVMKTVNKKVNMEFISPTVHTIKKKWMPLILGADLQMDAVSMSDLYDNKKASLIQESHIK